MHTRSRNLVLALMACGLMLGPTDALACGASLFGTGQNARFQAYRARQPAEILIYAGPQLAGGSTATDPAIRSGLEKAGHKVTIVSDATALDSALRQHHYDVVIASAADTDSLARQVGSGPQSSSLLPILDSAGKTGSGFRADNHPQALRAGAGLGQFLHAINKLMESHSP